MYDDTTPIQERLSPEILKPALEYGENSEISFFNELLSGMHDLANTSGHTTSVDFFYAILEELESRGIELNETRFEAIMSSSFGNRDNLRSRFDYDTFSDYPEDVQRAILAYLKEE